MKKGFTLVEMLVVIGIIAVLTGASVVGLSKMRASAERATLRELVSNTATALATIYEKDNVWPRKLEDGNSEGVLNGTAAYPLADAMQLTKENRKLGGLNRLGILDPWGAAVMKRKGDGCSDSDPVESGGTVKDHTLHYAIDLDGDGITDAKDVGGATLKIRASAVVWSCGKDGTVTDYNSKESKRSDDVFSWNRGQVVQQ